MITFDFSGTVDTVMVVKIIQFLPVTISSYNFIAVCSSSSQCIILFDQFCMRCSVAGSPSQFKVEVCGFEQCFAAQHQFLLTGSSVGCFMQICEKSVLAKQCTAIYTYLAKTQHNGLPTSILFIWGSRVAHLNKYAHAIYTSVENEM